MRVTSSILADRELSAFGFITTKSISQSFSRKVLDQYLNARQPIHLSFVVPNHPWVDATNGDDVRVAMTVARPGHGKGRLRAVLKELPSQDIEVPVELGDEHGEIFSNLKVGADILSAGPLNANDGVCSVGVQISGKGFVVDASTAQHLAEYEGESRVRPLRSARDLVQMSRNLSVIDLFGLEEGQVRQRYPAIYQWVLDRVKPERQQNCEPRFRERWWLHSRPREEFREATRGLRRYVGTPLTSKHRVFIFQPYEVICDSTCVTLAFDDAFVLGILSSRIHVTWAIQNGGRLGVGDDPRYLKAECFDTFPFPDCTEAQKQKIRELGEALDAHRKRQQAAHPGLTITDMYNVLEKLRSGEALSEKEKRVHEQGLVSVLKQIHDDLDAAVAEAYGWPVDLSDEHLLAKLVALNHERAQEERRGIVRWLRPEFQNPSGAAAVQTELSIAAKGTVEKNKPAAKLTWPKSAAEQAQALRAALISRGGPASAAELARTFKSAPTQTVRELLNALRALGQIRQLDDQRFAA